MASLAGTGDALGGFAVSALGETLTGMRGFAQHRNLPSTIPAVKSSVPIHGQGRVGDCCAALVVMAGQGLE